MSTRQLNTLFAVLDISYLLTYCGRLPSYLNDAWHGQLLASVLLLMNLLVATSAYGFLRERSWRFWLSYLLFPCRIAFAIMSFAWLAELILALSPSHPRLHEMVWLSAIALEGVRLGVTLMLHRMQATNYVCLPAAAESQVSI